MWDEGQFWVWKKYEHVKKQVYFKWKLISFSLLEHHSGYIWVIHTYSRGCHMSILRAWLLGKQRPRENRTHPDFAGNDTCEIPW